MFVAFSKLYGLFITQHNSFLLVFERQPVLIAKSSEMPSSANVVLCGGFDFLLLDLG